MSEDTYIGIDPGASGATVILSSMSGTWEDTRAYILRHDCTDREYVNKLYIWDTPSEWAYRKFALIENVHSMPREGVTSAFKFGKDFGFRLGVLVSLSVPHELVSPTVWQRAMGIQKKKGETNTQKKNRHKARAEQLFPSIQVTHRNADALLIAEYCRRVRQGVTA